METTIAILWNMLQKAHLLKEWLKRQWLGGNRHFSLLSQSSLNITIVACKRICCKTSTPLSLYLTDENFILKHDRAFLLSMANRGKDTNGSQFFMWVTCVTPLSVPQHFTDSILELFVVLFLGYIFVLFFDFATRIEFIVKFEQQKTPVSITLDVKVQRNVDLFIYNCYSFFFSCHFFL